MRLFFFLGGKASGQQKKKFQVLPGVKLKIVVWQFSRLPSCLTTTSSSQVLKTIIRFDNSREGLIELSESCYTHCYGLLKR